MLNSAVNSSGADLAGDAGDRQHDAGEDAGQAVGRTTFQITWVRVQPMPNAASFMRCGTIVIASSAVRTTVGSISTASATPPASAE